MSAVSSRKIVPPPREVDLRRLLPTCSGLWLLASLVSGIAMATGIRLFGQVVPGRWLATCLVGLGLGLLGLLARRTRQ